MTWRKVLWAVVAPKRNGLWSSDLRWIKVERRLIPVMCICGGDTPNGFGATELWKLTRFGKRENRLNLGAHIFRSDYAIMTELAPTWSPFHVLCDDLHIVGDTPIKIWSNPALKLTKFGKCENRLQFRSLYLPVRLCYHDRTCTRNEALSTYFVMISILLVTPHIDLE